MDTTISSEAVSISDDRGALHGTLTWPAGSGPVPGLLIVAGSGPVDRDGNLPGFRNDSLKQLAEALTRRGIACLRTDKRGIGQSHAAVADESELRFATFVSDTVSWIARLKTETRIGRVCLLGHSEGGLVVTLTAQQVEVAGLVLLAAAGHPAGQMIRRQVAQQGVIEETRATIDRILAALERGETVAQVPAELAPLFRPSVQPYLISWLTLDPPAELAKTRAPALVVQGTTDRQVELADARRLACARPAVSLAMIEGMNHILKASSTNPHETLMTFSNPDLPVVPKLVDAITDFIRP